MADKRNKPYAKELGAKIRAARNGTGVSMRSLAKECGLSHGHLSEIETGTSIPSVEVVQTICAALGISISRVLPDKVAV